MDVWINPLSDLVSNCPCIQTFLKLASVLCLVSCLSSMLCPEGIAGSVNIVLLPSVCEVTQIIRGSSIPGGMGGMIEDKQLFTPIASLPLGIILLIAWPFLFDDMSPFRHFLRLRSIFAPNSRFSWKWEYLITLRQSVSPWLIDINQIAVALWVPTTKW